MLQIITRLAALRRDDRAQDLTEYGLLAGLIAIVVVGAVTNLGAALTVMWDTIAGGMAAVL
jgi:Flp pilus assembly pilin Flp